MGPKLSFGMQGDWIKDRETARGSETFDIDNATRFQAGSIAASLLQQVDQWHQRDDVIPKPL